LLAAERAGVPFDPDLRTPPKLPPWREAPFMQSSVLQAGLMLISANEPDLSERFLTHLVESLDDTQAAQLGQMAVDMDRPHLAVMIAKRAARTAQLLYGAYYPMHPVGEMDLPMAPEMTLAIARRESEFDPVVVSHAGARGLMQLMPGTAKAMAAEAGVDYDLDLLTADAAYNARLGTQYLAKMIGEFGPNYMLVAAAYNAGPSRPKRWIVDFGDPRAPQVDAVDWIEHIPFDETRNYIMRVTESLPVYRARLHGRTEPITLSADLEAR
jgi:soluble lytic murein transglycosylase